MALTERNQRFGDWKDPSALFEMHREQHDLDSKAFSNVTDPAYYLVLMLSGVKTEAGSQVSTTDGAPYAARRELAAPAPEHTDYPSPHAASGVSTTKVSRRASVGARRTTRLPALVSVPDAPPVSPRRVWCLNHCGASTRWCRCSTHHPSSRAASGVSTTAVPRRAGVGARRTTRLPAPRLVSQPLRCLDALVSVPDAPPVSPRRVWCLNHCGASTRWCRCSTHHPSSRAASGVSTTAVPRRAGVGARRTTRLPAPRLVSQTTAVPRRASVGARRTTRLPAPGLVSQPLRCSTRWCRCSTHHPSPRAASGVSTTAVPRRASVGARRTTRLPAPGLVSQPLRCLDALVSVLDAPPVSPRRVWCLNHCGASTR
ncbi:hypothetical protein BKA62DRAFT_778235 [Auriculariales sp. MPI-PUGE-AT-0066]|nr:hypothetical protein BKA62DRAFT_778235 [Auriculariales sp. MPI-PUGE-AT-0066]